MTLAGFIAVFMAGFTACQLLNYFIEWNARRYVRKWLGEPQQRILGEALEDE